MLLFVLIGIWFAPARAESTLLVLGDSLSAAYGIEQKNGWVELLQQRLDTEGHAVKVLNASVSGETTAGGRTRIPRLLARHNPDILIVELGGNDGLRGLSLKEMYDNLDFIVQSARQQGARVLIAGMRLPPNYGIAYTSEFQRVYQRVAAKHRADLVPFLLEGLPEDRTLFQADGIHPTTAAQPVILENIWAELLPLLKQLRAAQPSFDASR